MSSINYTNFFKIKFKGFTLLETLVSIGILALVIIGPLAVIMNSNSYARQTKDTMVATYLAEESIELLQNQYDSLYILCKKDPDNTLCTSGTPAGETAGHIAWYLFKQRLGDGGTGYPSCFLTAAGGAVANSAGCSFDFAHMIGNITDNPPRYISTSNEESNNCLYLIGASTTILKPDGHDGYERIERHTYVCKGDPSHTNPPSLTTSLDAKPFTRKVSIEWMQSSFETDPSLLNYYNDDLRIVSTVGYKGSNGYPAVVTVTRFMHSRP